MTAPRDVPAGAVPVDVAELEAMLDAGATRQEIRQWLAEQAAHSHGDDQEGGAGFATAQSPPVGW